MSSPVLARTTPRPPRAPRRAPRRVLVIADDLTGTLDAVAAFAGAGADPWVGFRPEAIARAPALARCLAVNADTRHAPPEVARRVVADLARRGLALGIDIVFKKTDSTLRGNVAAELAGLAEAGTGDAPVVFAPAFPEAGRTVRGGVLRVDGVEVSRTSFGSDPRSPARESSVPALLRSAFPAERCRLEHAPRPGAGPRWAASLKPGCAVFDSEVPEELDTLADALARCRRRPLLLAGSGGLARRLPRICGDVAAASGAELPPGPALILHGSITPRSLEQIARFQAGGGLCIELGPDWLWCGPDQRARFENAWWMRIGCAFAEGASVLVHTTAPNDVRTALARLGPPRRTAADYAAGAPHAMAGLGRRILELTDYRTLVLGGGETSQAAIDALGMTHGRAGGEVWIGVNRLTARALGRRFEVVTKSGGLGPADLYARFLP